MEALAVNKAKILSFTKTIIYDKKITRLIKSGYFFYQKLSSLNYALAAPDLEMISSSMFLGTCS